MERITTQEILDAIAKVKNISESNPLNAVTIEEISNLSHRSRSWALIRVKKLVNEGTLKVTYVKKRKMDGCVGWIPAYYIATASSSSDCRADEIPQQEGE